MPVQQSQELYEVRQTFPWYRKLCLFYKVFNNEHPKYLFHLIPVRCTSYATRTESNIPLLRQSVTFSKILFFHLLLLIGITQTPILEILRVFQSLRKKYLILYDLPQILFFKIRNPKGIKLITRLGLGLSHLREHKFKHSFQDTLNPLCNCGQDIESTTHFFFHCPFFFNERRTLLSTIRSLDSKLLDFTDYDLTQTLLFGNTSQTSSNNFKIINASIDYILASKRFDEPLF